MNPLSGISKRPAAPVRAQLRNYWSIYVILGLAMVGALVWVAAGMPGNGSAARHQQPITAHQSEAAEDAVARAVVTLPPARLAEAKIETAPVGRKPIRSEATVSARVTHDATRHLTVTAPLDCVVEDVLVRPGQQISPGDRLLILTSPEVGMARDRVARAKDDLRLAQREANNAEEVLENVQSLLALLEQSPAPAVALKQFSGKRLAEHREHVLGAYSKMLLAKRTLDDTGDLGSSGALSRRVIQQRQSDYEVAVAGLDSQRETTLFESQQARDKAAAALAQQDRLLQVDQGRLKTLLGSLAVEETDADASSAGSSLSQFIVIATLAGRVEDHVVIKHQRLSAGDEILTIGDTSVLWVSANIHEHQWQATALKPGDEVRVRFPALGDQQSTAKVHFVGSQVSEETRSLPIVAEIGNTDGKLRPGMFAWVTLPLQELHEAVVVPSSAIMRHEGQAFVFADEGEGKFRRIDVQLGRELSDAVEVVSGLTGDERIAISGAFLLKSELLLEDEE